MQATAGKPARDIMQLVAAIFALLPLLAAVQAANSTNSTVRSSDCKQTQQMLLHYQCVRVRMLRRKLLLTAQAANTDQSRYDLELQLL